jgi:DMSO/TMAO reductase YedYZ molybdopterin-dependent catalytic subunit
MKEAVEWKVIRVCKGVSVKQLYCYLICIPVFALSFIACTPTPATAVIPSPTPTTTSTAMPVHAQPGVVVSCALPAVNAPTPAATPNYAELDPSTGLHYTGKAHTINLASYRLEINGLVDYPLELSYDDLRCMPKIEVQTTIVCIGNFDDTAVWAGASLQYILELAGIQPQAKNIRLIGADGYSASVSKKDAMSGKAFLAYEWEKQPVPIIHGFPVRAAFPGLLGANWVKWLIKIEVY